MASFPGQKGTGAPLPNPVGSLTATPVSATEIDLAWTSQAGMLYFNVYLDGVLISSPVTNSLADTTVTAGSTHSYQVSAVNSNGEGVRSPAVSALTFPAQVTGLVANAVSSSEIDSTWTPVPTATSYEVFRNGTLVGTPVGASFHDTGLPASTTFSYTVAAVNASGTGMASAAVNATTQAGGGGRIVWNSGWYVGLNGVLNVGQAASSQFSFLNTGLNAKPQVIGWNMRSFWGCHDYGPVTFTGSLSGATSGTLTATPAGGGVNGTYWFKFSDGSYRDVTVTGTSCVWTGAVTASASAWAYNFQQVSDFINQLSNPANYGAAKQLIWTVSTCTIGANVWTHPTSQFVPSYIQTDSVTYGTGGFTGSSGIWGPNSSGTSTGSYASCVWRAAVMQKVIDCFATALGAWLTAHPTLAPFLEGIGFQEVFGIGNGSSNGDSTALDTNLNAQALRLWQAMTAALPKTNIFYQCGDQVGQSGTIAGENQMFANRIGQANADTLSNSKITASPFSYNGNWGMNCYGGATGFSAIDRRGIFPCVMLADTPDLTQARFGNGTSADFIAGVQLMKTTHQIVTMVSASDGVSPAGFNNTQLYWSNLVPVLASNSITQPYPPASSGYPQ